MKNWLKRVGSAVLVGLTWAVVWGPIGVLIGMIVDPDGSMDEMWVAIGAYPGFFCGAVFSIVLGILEGIRNFDEWSIPRIWALGAGVGLLVGVLPLAVAEPITELPRWLLGVAVVGSMALLSSVSAVGSLALARAARPWRTLLVPFSALGQSKAVH